MASTKSTQADGSAVATTLRLADGDALDFVRATDVTRDAPTKVIVIAGAEDSGKTTLLTTIYESFQQNQFGGYLFAGSVTLVGFEQRCHRARISSGANEANTERTRSGDLKLLHLAVRDKKLEGDVRHLLISDLPGESFRIIRDSTDECKKLELLRRADVLVVLLDGGKLATPKSRTDAMADGYSLIRSCLDAGMIGTKTNLSVVLTKWDKILANEKQSKSYIEHLRAEGKERFEKRLNTLKFFEVAARPRHGASIPFGFGCAELFDSWVTSETPSPVLGSRPPLDIESAREMDRFAMTRQGV